MMLIPSLDRYSNWVSSLSLQPRVILAFSANFINTLVWFAQTSHLRISWPTNQNTDVVIPCRNGQFGIHFIAAVCLNDAL